MQNPRARFALRWAIALTALCTPVSAQKTIDLPRADAALELSLAPLFTVGKASGAPYETFGNPWAVAFDADAQLYVLDAQAAQVHVFDKAGKYVRTIGKRGAGPGELQAPAGLAISTDGFVVVNDPAKGGLQLFDRTGTYLAATAYDPAVGQLVGPIAAHPKGGIVGETRVLPEEANQLPPVSSAHSLWRIPLETGAKAEYLFVAPPQELVQTDVARDGDAQVFAVGPRIFEPRLRWALLSDGRIISTAVADYRLQLSTGARDGITTVQRAIEPRTVTASDREQYLANRENARRVFIPAPNARYDATAVANMPAPDPVFADRIPVISRLGVDGQGRIWAQRFGQLGTGVIDVLSAGGSYLGTLAEQAMPHAFGPDGRVAYITTDANDVPVVIVQQARLP
jgi:hypothetical protein